MPSFATNLCVSSPRFRSFVRVSASLGALALLSACAQTPKLTVEQEATEYRSHARRSYSHPGPANDPWRPFVKEASDRFDVPERWIREVMRQESGGRALAQSGPGAMGLMQVMPGTYDELRGRYPDLGLDAFDPHDNILAGTAYIRELYDIYGSPGFLAAYNAGPGRLDDYLTRGRTLPTETRRYVASIGPRIAGSEPGRTSPGAAYAMNAIPLDIPSGPRYVPDARYSGSSPIQTAYAAPPAAGPLAAALRPIVLGQSTADQLMGAPPSSGTLASVQVAAVEPVVRPIVLGEPTISQVSAGSAYEPAPRPTPAPVQVASMPEPVMRPITLGQPTPQPERYAAQVMPAVRSPAPSFMPTPPVPVQSASQQFAAFSPRNAPPSLPVPPAVPVTQVAAYAQPVASRSGGAFRLVAPAMAEPIGRVRAPAGPERGAWAVQVGAFANDRLAAQANAQARDTARELNGTSATVSGVRQGATTLYRARLHGLSREGAQQACERLSRQHMNCILVSPDAQS